VATSKPSVYAERIIDHFGLRNHFEQSFLSLILRELLRKSAQVLANFRNAAGSRNPGQTRAPLTFLKELL
jgi:hypothetical protein